MLADKEASQGREAARALIKALPVPSAALIFKARGLDPT
jgi:hypothetical protein